MISHVLPELKVFNINISKQKQSTMTLRLSINRQGVSASKELKAFSS